LAQRLAAFQAQGGREFLIAIASSALL